MSHPSPYEQLGVTEDASTEEILEARDRLLVDADQGSDRKLREQIETAYDAVLMDRLRLRQEGKIKVPDRIRFPEKTTQQAPSIIPALPQPGPNWLRQWFAPENVGQLWLPTVIFLGLAGLAFFYPALQQAVLLIGVIASSYFLYVRERRMGRAILLSLAALLVGFLIGGLLWTVLKPQLVGIGLQANLLDSLLVTFLLWLLSSFGR